MPYARTDFPDQNQPFADPRNAGSVGLLMIKRERPLLPRAPNPPFRNLRFVFDDATVKEALMTGQPVKQGLRASKPTRPTEAVSHRQSGFNQMPPAVNRDRT